MASRDTHRRANRPPRAWPQFERAQKATAHYAALLLRCRAARPGGPVPLAERPLAGLAEAGSHCLACASLDACSLWLTAGATPGAGPSCALTAAAGAARKPDVRRDDRAA